MQQHCLLQLQLFDVGLGANIQLPHTRLIIKSNETRHNALECIVKEWKVVKGRSKKKKKEPVSCLIDHAGTPGIYSACLIIYSWATFRLRWTWQNVVYPIPPPLICIRSSSSYLSDASQDAPDCRLALSEYGACLPDRLDRQTSNYNNNNVLGWNIIKSLEFQLKRKTSFLISFPYFSYGI